MHVEIKNKRPHLISDAGEFEIVRWFPSSGGLTVAGLTSTALLTPVNCDLDAVKKTLASLITSPS